MPITRNLGTPESRAFWADAEAAARRVDSFPPWKLGVLMPKEKPVSKPKKYRVGAQVTISIYTDVEASSREEALEIAAGRDMAAIHHATHDTSAIAAKEWVTSGELDGEPRELRVEDD
jgi:hypothetical protein